MSVSGCAVALKSAIGQPAAAGATVAPISAAVMAPKPANDPAPLAAAPPPKDDLARATTPPEADPVLSETSSKPERTAVAAPAPSPRTQEPATPREPTVEKPAPVRTASLRNGVEALAAPSDDAGPSATPSLFGTVALRVSHTPLDGKWRTASNAPAKLPASWAAAEAGLRTLSGLQRLRAVNAWVNHNVTFESDEQLYGVSDHWASLQETAANGAGDCEDYAIAKLEMLKLAGVSSRDLYLVVARDLVRRADHALLAVRVDGEFWVLDSGTDAPLQAEQVRDYVPLITLSADDHAWIHGVRQAPAAITIAAADAPNPAAQR